MKRSYRWAATLGISALCLGAMGIAPSLAQGDYYQRDHDRRDVRRDVNDVRRDERRLSDLERQRDRADRRGDWRAVRNLDRRIDDLQRHIDRDRDHIRHDVHEIHRDRY